MKQLDPKAVWLFFFGNFLTVIFLGIFFSLWISNIVFVIVSGLLAVADINTLFLTMALTIILLIVIAIAIAYGLARLTYHFYRYELTDLGFKKESGIIWKKYVTIPYDRIQNVDIHRGLLARLLGLSDINIQTAGLSSGGGRQGFGYVAEGRLPGLSVADAEALQIELLTRARGQKGQGL